MQASVTARGMRARRIQRINTTGGAAPASGCEGPSDLGKQARVAYTADYFFYAPR